MNIRKGDTIRDPKHIEGGEIMTFDRVIANPPLSLSKWGKNTADNDSFDRLPYGTTSEGSGDFTFVQHMIATLNAEGVLGVVISTVDAMKKHIHLTNSPSIQIHFLSIKRDIGWILTMRSKIMFGLDQHAT